MRLFFFSLLNAAYLLCLLNNSVSAPPEYCLRQPNTSDCGAPPKPMYYYYKPGSRCETKIWRGCFTYNMFDTEALCSHVCLFPFIRKPGESPEAQDTCRSKLNVNKCTNERIKVYTYDTFSKTCLTAIWRGCNTSNLFNDENDCLTTCKPSHSSKTTPDFEDKVQLLGPKVGGQIASMLDAFTPKMNKKIEAKEVTFSDYTDTTSGMDTVGSTDPSIHTKSGMDTVGSTDTSIHITTVEHPQPSQQSATSNSVAPTSLPTTTDESYEDPDPVEVLTP